MQHCERQQHSRSRHPERPEMPAFYMPAMWPVDLQQRLIDWFVAWRKRQLYRRLLRLTDRQLQRRDLSRARIRERAGLPLRQVVAERRRLRAQEECRLGQ